MLKTKRIDEVMGAAGLLMDQWMGSFSDYDYNQ